MKSVIVKRAGTGALVLAGMAALLLSSAPVRAAGNPNPGVMPPNSHPYGKSYNEWANSWWQWVDSIPMSVSPLIDSTGADCAQGQSGQVWFLAGSPGGSYTRNCTIPAGKAVFFPVANFQEDALEVVPDFAFFGSDDCPDVYGSELCSAAYDALAPDPEDPANMFAFITLIVDAFVDPNAKFATLDEKAITNLADYRSPSGPAGYVINLPDTDVAFDNYHSIFGYSFDGPLTYMGVQDGYYLMLKPLTAGTHELQFGESPGWVITYHLTVQ